MKKGGLFSGSLYREGLRQTRALGWTLFGLSLGGLLMGFVMQFGVALTSPSATQTPSIVDLYDGAPLLFLLFIWAPILVLVLFNLVTRRNQCDFYHALPHTRVQLAGSYLAAALTWTLGSLLASFGLFVILYTCLPDTLAIVNLTGALHSLVSSTVLVLLITGGTFLAVSLTGTMVSAMLGTGLILFMPRILLGIVTTQMVSAAPIVSVDDLPFPLSSVNLLANYFSRSHASVMHAPLTTLLYTFLLGALYFGLGLWAFSRRKSERAGSAAISHGAQAIFRVLIAAPILLGAAVLVINTFVIHPEEWGELGYSIAFATLSSAFTLLGVSLG
ncbi:MAG: hypothetical protein IKI63_06015, partial [Clostridia bacterium]|nr:hypothetical protein [Clostridia bacterium]